MVRSTRTTADSLHHRHYRHFAWLAAVLLVLPSLALANSGWKRIVDEDGVQVMERRMPGQVFPTFRGIGIIDAGIYDVLAVVSDIERHTEWVERCMAVRVLQQRGYRFYVVYSRTDVPWPISDRDAVYRSKVSIDEAKREVAVNFKAVKSNKVGPVDGVVRMERLKGHFKFTWLADNRTRIDYQIDADPGGWIPKWLARLATRKLPLSTIQGLRKQVVKTRGWYAKRIKQWKAGNY